MDHKMCQVCQSIFPGHCKIREAIERANRDLPDNLGEQITAHEPNSEQAAQALQADLGQNRDDEKILG